MPLHLRAELQTPCVPVHGSVMPGKGKMVHATASEGARWHWRAWHARGGRAHLAKLLLKAPHTLLGF